ncbi:MAG: lysine biosynthesis protein LysW [Nanoarchaeota archaeon]|nr:lysine biosynthesis protein LysW [Nanoarchaeota archaeon]
MVECTECGAALDVDEKKLEKGEIINCRDCGVELEVMSLDTVKVAPAPEEDEDWGQ